MTATTTATTTAPTVFTAEELFRAAVLDRDEVCRCTVPACHGPEGDPCRRWSEVVVRYPLRRAELVDRGLDPTDSVHGLGVCRRCWTAHRRVPHPGLVIRGRTARRAAGPAVTGLGGPTGQRAPALARARLSGAATTLTSRWWRRRGEPIGAALLAADTADTVLHTVVWLALLVLAAVAAVVGTVAP